MLTALLLGISTFTSILWSIVFLFPQYFNFVLYHITGNLLNAFIPSIKTYSYSSNEEPSGWIIGWEDGFYIGFLSCRNGNGNGNHEPMKSLYIFTSKKFYKTYISKNDSDNDNDNDNSKKNKNKVISNEDKSINLFIREGSFWCISYLLNTYKAPNKLFPPRVTQTLIINEIMEKYNILTNPNVIILLCSKPGFGKSILAIHLCYELRNKYEKVSLVTTWNPTDPNDNFSSMYNKVKPSAKAPLVILLDEIDITVKNMLEGKIKISDVSPMPIAIKNKRDWNTFFDSFDIEIYKYVIIIMTSNKTISYFNDLDPSLLRDGRINIVKNCEDIN